MNCLIGHLESRCFRHREVDFWEAFENCAEAIVDDLGDVADGATCDWWIMLGKLQLRRCAVLR